jgi:hypothetical protein
MTGLVEVFGGVATRRVVTTTDVTADPAHPEMDPLASEAEAVLTAFRGGFDLLDLVEMVAELLGVRHGVSSPSVGDRFAPVSTDGTGRPSSVAVGSVRW